MQWLEVDATVDLLYTRGPRFCLMSAIIYTMPTNPEVGYYSHYLLSDPENKHSIAVGISLLSCTRYEIYVISYYILLDNDRHLTLMSAIIQTSPTVLPDPENMDIAVGISFRR